MEMDDMFDTGGGSDDERDQDESDDDDDLPEYSAANRYQPTVEAITQEDAMEIQQQAVEAEMIEDVGSLAQSLGASHLGRSLQLQAEIAKLRKDNLQQKNSSIQQKFEAAFCLFKHTY